MTGPMYRPPGHPDVVRHGMVACPSCRYPIDAAGSVDGKPGPAPKTGDYSICFGCAEPAVYEVDALGRVGLRAPTADERAECVAENGEYIARLRAFNRRGRQR